MSDKAEQLTLSGHGTCCGKMSQARSVRQMRRISGRSLKRPAELQTAEYLYLDLRPGYGNLLGPYWEVNSPLLGAYSTLNTGPAPRSGANASSLSAILQGSVPEKYYLSTTACLGILRRAKARGKELPVQLRRALEIQAGIREHDEQPVALEAYHINQRNEGIDLDGISGALMATHNMQMQTFVTQEPAAGLEDGATNCLTPWDTQSRRVFGDDGVWPSLYGGDGGGRRYVKTEDKQALAFCANQRDEVRELGDCAGALQAQPGMKQQTFVAVPIEGCLTPWDTQQSRIFTPDALAPCVAGADGGGGRNPAGLLFSAGVVTKGNGECILSPERHTALTSGGGQAGQGYPCVLTAGFCAGAAPAAGSIGYQEECAPTLKGSSSGTNMVPSVLCLNDQGGRRMDLSEDVSGTLRAQMDGHPPLVLGQVKSELFENHGIDSRYTGPHEVAPTMSARYGTGGNNVPLVSGQAAESYCIAGNIIDREPHNGGNGFGYQPGICYTLNTADRHAVFAQQRSDEYADSGVACTQAARQYKDATDLVCDVAGLDCRNGEENGDLCGTLQSKTTGGYSLNNVHPVRTGSLIRRLTPLECERLQGFPDGWTDIGPEGPSVALPEAKHASPRTGKHRPQEGGGPMTRVGGSDSSRYKALGNSVAIPCVQYVMRGIAHFLRKSREEGR